MSEKMREEFEAWAEAHFVEPNLKRYPLGHPRYAEDEIQIAYEAFHAGMQAAQRQGGAGWKQAVDNELVTSLQCTADSYDDPRQAVKDVIDWHVQVATDPRVNGGYELVRQGGKAVGWLEVEHWRGMPNYQNVDYEHGDVTLPPGRHPLYTAPQPAVPDINLARKLYNAGYQAGHEETVEATLSPMSHDDEFEEHDDEVREIINSYRPFEGVPTQTQPAVPEGWKLVPASSTSEMDLAGADADIEVEIDRHDAETIWDYMIAKAPEPPEET